MFYKMVMRNSRRSRKENGLFFSSLLISIVAFYVILSLLRQDVMLFLEKMESNAVDRLMGMIPVFFYVTLILLFFLIYYAGSYQMDRRRHEFGVYLVMGMRRRRLFAMLFAEDLGGSLLALALGIPSAVLLSELISLVTARLVGLGIIGHRFTFSPEAVLGTAAGFLIIKLAAFLLISGRIAAQETGALLTDKPSGTKRQLPLPVYWAAAFLGVVLLGTAYGTAISGISWENAKAMGLTLLAGLAGTGLFFFGLRALLGFLAIAGGKRRGLEVFDYRQLQEQVILRSNTLAVSSLLMLAALCCFGAGVGVAGFYGSGERHVLDYTFGGKGMSAEECGEILEETGLDAWFSELFEIRLGYIRTTDDHENAFCMDSIMTEVSRLEKSREQEILLNNLSYVSYPYLIAVSGYNRLLAAAGNPLLELGEGEAAVYMDGESLSYQRKEIMDQILKGRPEVVLDGTVLHLTGEVQTENLVTDRVITLSFAVIVPDALYEYYTQGDGSIYLNGILDKVLCEETSLMNAVGEMNDRLDDAGIPYEGYLQNMGRQLFFLVAAGYIAIYLAVIFLIIANTVLGVQFLMAQRKSGRRYRTLIRLGASHQMLCRSAGRQIGWYFGIPTLVAVCSSFFGIRALFSGLLPTIVRGSISEMMQIGAAMIFVLFVIESVYVAAMKRSSNRYLLSLMVPEREE